MPSFQGLLDELARIQALSAQVAQQRKDIDKLRADFDDEKKSVDGLFAQLDSIPSAGLPQAPLPPAPAIPFVPTPLTVVNGAPDVDPNDPELFVQPPGDPRDSNVWYAWIKRAAQVTRHVDDATPDQYQYWSGVREGLVARGVELGQSDYAWKKLIGWQSTGADKPTYGPFR